MAKLATQTIVIQVSKAVSDNDSQELVLLDNESILQLSEAVEALAGESGVVVEVTNG